MLLDVQNIKKSFGGVAAVDDASFNVHEGSITALIGPNGAGKTTAFNLISGFIKPESGVIRFAGKAIAGKTGDAIARLGLVRSFQAARVLTRMSVLENMTLAARHQPGERLRTAWGWSGKAALREREVQRKALEILELVRLGHLAGEYAGTLSGGQRKLLELGRALMVEPRMVLLDEPMAGVAPALADQLVDHIRELRASREVTVLVIEHDMNVVMSISDRVLVMDEGKVIADGTPAEIQRNERVIEAYLGRLETDESI